MADESRRRVGSFDALQREIERATREVGRVADNIIADAKGDAEKIRNDPERARARQERVSREAKGVGRPPTDYSGTPTDYERSRMLPERYSQSAARDRGRIPAYGRSIGRSAEEIEDIRSTRERAANARATAEQAAKRAQAEAYTNQIFQQRQRLLGPATSIQLGPGSPGQYGPGTAEGRAAFEKYNAARPGPQAQSLPLYGPGNAQGRSDFQKFSSIEAEKAAAKSAQLNKLMAGGAQAAFAQGRGFEYISRALAQSSDEYTRNGALTTEFISAAAKGQVTIRELGSQVLQTVAKFGGWTLAATAVFAAAAAVQQFGKGAIDSLGAVTDLTRIIGNLDKAAASQNIRDIAQKFNLPIADVGATAYNLSKVFASSPNPQKQTFDATRAVAGLVKVGEIDPENAAKYTTALSKGFKLSGSELQALADTANQVTNKFGGVLKEVVEGTAASANSFKRAGGTYREGIAFIETGILTTGRTGSEIGTALRRTSEIIKRPERRQGILELLGVDPATASITQVLRKAQSEIAKATAAGDQGRVSQIGRAITTPELFSRGILAITQNKSLFERVLSETDAKKAAGSIDRELKRALQGPREELKKFSVTLQRLGSAAADAGLLTGLGIALKTLNAMLNAVTRITEAVGKLGQSFKILGQPISGFALAFAGLAATIGLLKRFDTGRFLGVDALRRAELPATRAQIVKGLESEIEQRRLQQVTGYTRARELGGAAQRTRAKLAGGDITDPKQRILQAERAAQLEADALQSAIQADAAGQELESRKAALRNIRRGAYRNVDELTRAAAGQNIGYRISNLDIPNGEQPAPIGGRVNQPFADALGGARGSAAATAAGAEEAAARQRTLGGIIGRNVNSFARFSSEGRNLGGRLRAFGSRAASAAASLASAIGPLDLAVVGVIAIFSALQQIDEQGKQLDELQNAKDASQVRSLARRELGDRSILEKGTGFVGRNVLAPIFRGVGGTLGNGLADRFSLTQDQIADEAAKKKLQELREVNRQAASIRGQASQALAAAQNAGPAEGAKILGTAGKRIQAQAKTIATVFGPQFAAAVVKASADALASIQQANASTEQARGNLAKALRTITTGEGLKAFGQSGLNRESLGVGSRAQNLSRLAGAAAALRVRAISEKDVTKQTDLISAADQFDQAVIASAKTRIDAATKYAATPQAAAAATQRILAETRRELVGGARTSLVNARLAAQQAAAARDKEIARDPITPAIATDPAAIAKALEDKRKRVTKLAEAARLAEKNIGAAQAALKKAQQEYRDFAREARAAAFQDRLSGFDASTGLLESQTGDPLEKAAIGVRRLAQRVGLIRSAIARGVAKQADLETALAQYNDAQRQLASAQIDRFASQVGAARSRANVNATDGQIQAGAVRDAKRILDYTRSRSGDPGQIAQAEQQYYDALRSYREFQRQQAQALLDAQEQYALAGTNSSLTEANIRLAYAKRRASFARTPVERLTARANIREAQRNQVNAKQQDAFDEIEWQAEMGRIDRETEIRRLTGLAKQVKNNKSFRREILRRIKALKDEQDNFSQLELNPNDIRLPTTVEIRKAIRGGLDRSRNVQVTQANTVNLNVQPGSEGLVGHQIDRVLGTSTRSALRSAG